MVVAANNWHWLITREEGTKISDFNTWIEKFCSVKASLQVIADKPSQERFWKQKFHETVKTKVQTQKSQ